MAGGEEFLFFGGELDDLNFAKTVAWVVGSKGEYGQGNADHAVQANGGCYCNGGRLEDDVTNCVEDGEGGSHSLWMR